MIPLCISPWQGWKRISFLIGRVNLTKPLAPSSNHKCSPGLVRDTNPLQPAFVPNPECLPQSEEEWNDGWAHSCIQVHGTSGPSLQCAWGCAMPFGNETPATHICCWMYSLQALHVFSASFPAINNSRMTQITSRRDIEESLMITFLLPPRFGINGLEESWITPLAIFSQVLTNFIPPKSTCNQPRAQT